MSKKQIKIPGKKNNGKTARNKGNTYERDIRSMFVSLGFTKAKSSRQSSRLYDDCAIDHWGVILPSGRLIFTQCKSGYRERRPKADEEFLKQNKRVEDNFPPGSKELDNPLQILFHKIDGYRPENHLVTLKYDDFLEIFKKYVESVNSNNKTS